MNHEKINSKLIARCHKIIMSFENVIIMTLKAKAAAKPGNGISIDNGSR